MSALQLTLCQMEAQRCSPTRKGFNLMMVLNKVLVVLATMQYCIS